MRQNSCSICAMSPSLGAKSGVLRWGSQLGGTSRVREANTPRIAHCTGCPQGWSIAAEHPFPELDRHVQRVPAPVSKGLGMSARGSELGAGLGGLHRTPVCSAARSSLCLSTACGQTEAGSPVPWDGAAWIFGINEVSAPLQWRNMDQSQPLLLRHRGDGVFPRVRFFPCVSFLEGLEKVSWQLGLRTLHFLVFVSGLRNAKYAPQPAGRPLHKC